MAMIASIQQAIEFIEKHLLDNITTDDIAKTAHMSPYHFQRTFMILTDMTVGEYVRRRRLTRAAQELSSTDLKITELAYKFGYDTPESFTKAFRKQHGIAPRDVRKGLGNIQSYNRLAIQVKLKGAEPMNYRIVERGSFYVAGLKAVLQCGENMEASPEIQKLWAKVGQDGTINQLLSLNSGEIKGLLGMTVDYSKEKNALDYWIATEINDPSADAYAVYEVEAAKWAVFEVVGPFASAIPAMWKKVYSEWFPSNNYEHSGAPSIEVYKSVDPTIATAQSEIWVPIK